MATFIEKLFEKLRMSESLKGQRSAASIFKILKALDITVTIYHWKVFSSLMSKKGTRNSRYLI